MKQIPDFLPLNVQAELQDAQPSVTVPSYATAKQVVKAMTMFAAGNSPTKDGDGKTFWYASIKDLIALIGDEAINNKMVGTACKVFQLARKRENTGWHVAWSQAQLDILNRHIK